MFVKLFALFVLIQLVPTSSQLGNHNNAGDDRIKMIRSILFNGVADMTNELLSAERQLQGREVPSSPSSPMLTGKVFESYMKMMNAKSMSNLTDLDPAFIVSMKSLNETLPQVIDELYLAFGTLSTRQDAQQNLFYQDPVTFVFGALYGVVLWNAITNLPAAIRATSAWMHETQESLTGAVDGFLHRNPKMNNQFNGSTPLYRDMGWNQQFFKGMPIDNDYVKNLFKI